MAFWRRASRSGADSSALAIERLRVLVQRSVEQEAAELMVTDAVLADVSEVLDQVLRDAAAASKDLDARVVNDLALVHRIRAMGLGHSGEELHACGALQVLGYVIAPGAAAPQTREEITDAIARGAATDLETALLRAMQGHAAAVRAAWRRAPSRGLADTFVRAFRRLVDLAGPKVPNFPTRLLDLSAALDARFTVDESRGALDDLNVAIDLASQAIRAAPEDRGVVRRAHQLLGPILVTRDEVVPGCGDLEAAVASFRKVVELTDADDPQYPAYLAKLRTAEHLVKNLQ